MGNAYKFENYRQFYPIGASSEKVLLAAYLETPHLNHTSAKKLKILITKSVKRGERGGGSKQTERDRDKYRDVIKCLRARRVYPFHLSPDSHTVPANEKPTHANCQLGSLSVIWKCLLNQICIIS